MIVKPLTEHQFEFLSLKGGCRGSSEATLVKIPHCWKLRAGLICIVMELELKKCASVRKRENTVYHMILLMCYCYSVDNAIS